MNANMLESIEGFRDRWPVAARYTGVSGWRMHYVDEDAGDPIQLLHGNPTWGFLYRDVIPPLVNAGYKVPSSQREWAVPGSPVGCSYGGLGPRTLIRQGHWRTTL